MGFFRTMNKAKGFLNKAIDKTTGFGSKVLNGVEKGAGVVHKVLDIAGQAADKLTDVPIIGGLAGEIKPVINGAKVLTDRGQKGLKRIEGLNNKLSKVHI